MYINVVAFVSLAGLHDLGLSSWSHHYRQYCNLPMPLPVHLQNTSWFLQAALNNVRLAAFALSQPP